MSRRGSLKNLATAEQLMIASLSSFILSFYMFYKRDISGLWFFLLGFLTLLGSRFRRRR